MDERKGSLTGHSSGRHGFAIGTAKRRQGWVYWVLHMPQGGTVGDQVIPQAPSEFRGHFETKEKALEAARRAADRWVESRIGTEDAALDPPQTGAKLDPQ